MRLVIVESPFAGDVEENVYYARAALRDCFMRGESPFASHLLYTQDGILNDNNPEERKLGIDAGLLWGSHADATVVYVDRGISKGMWYGIENAVSKGRPVYYRSLPEYQSSSEDLVDLETLEFGDVFFIPCEDDQSIVGFVMSRETDESEEKVFWYNGMVISTDKFNRTKVRKLGKYIKE